MIIQLTDFGDTHYGGVLKGVIKNISPKSEIYDLDNNIPSHNIRVGAWVLRTNYRYYPKKTIFLSIVDPGVGTKRKPIIVETKNYTFIGPDNGLLYPAAVDDGIKEIRKIVSFDSSNTFHGRDIFAVAAARLDSKKELPTQRLDKLKSLVFHRDAREGEIVNIDKFGNIITNLESLDKKTYHVKVRDYVGVLYQSSNYDSEDDIFLVIGSCGTLEISSKKSVPNIKAQCGDYVVIE